MKAWLAYVIAALLVALLFYSVSRDLGVDDAGAWFAAGYAVGLCFGCPVLLVLLVTVFFGKDGER